MEQTEIASQNKQKCMNILGWLKQIYYIICWIIVILYAKEPTKTEEFGSNGFHWEYTDLNWDLLGPLIILMIIMSLIYIWTIVWLCDGKMRTLKLLNNMNENNNAINIIENLFKEKPEIEITCRCYHVETRKITYTDMYGKKQTTYTSDTYYSYSESKKLNIFSYLDISGIFRLKQTNKKYIMLQLGKEINFNDVLTLLDIENIKNDLYVRNRYKDEYITIQVNRNILSFKDFYLIKLTNSKNFLLHKWIYILCFILTIDKFYDLYIDCICAHQFFIIKKIVSARENVLQNPIYSKFISGYNINNQEVISQRESLGGIDENIEVKLPTEEEIEKSKAFNKYIPQYNINENGEVFNNNQNSLENLMEIKEKNTNNQMPNLRLIPPENTTKELNIVNDIHDSNYNLNEINQPLINDKQN